MADSEGPTPAGGSAPPGGTPSSGGPSQSGQSPFGGGWWAGSGDSIWASTGVNLAAVIMVITGIAGIVEGIAGIAGDDVFAKVGKYAFKLDVTAWGWIHLIIGILLLVAGIAVYGGAAWARVIAVVLTGLSIVANFLALPYQPLWSIVAIGLGVFVIWALFSVPDRHGRRA
jgi:hypothetical protein